MAIRRATTTDFGTLCTTAMRAFHDDPVMRWLYPDDDVYLQANGAVFAPSMTNWLTHRHVWCTDDAVSFATWFPPHDPHLADPEWIDVGPPPTAAMIARFELLRPLMRAHKPTEPHWYLQLLGTHPDWQRRGLGAALMQVVFDQADPAGVGCYLETERPELVAYYRHHGFEVTAEWIVDPDGTLGAVGPQMWGMSRPPDV